MAGLKLRAQDVEDLKVVSAMLQDAIVPICDLAYLPTDRRFVLIANRFRWEAVGDRPPPAGGPTADVELPYERINCAVNFQGIEHVGYRHLDLTDRKQMLNLLALEWTDGAAILHFSGGSCIKLTASSLDCLIEDVGESWPTGNRPCHVGLDDPSST